MATQDEVLVRIVIYSGSPISMAVRGGAALPLPLYSCVDAQHMHLCRSTSAVMPTSVTVMS